MGGVKTTTEESLSQACLDLVPRLREDGLRLFRIGWITNLAVQLTAATVVSIVYMPRASLPIDYEMWLFAVALWFVLPGLVMPAVFDFTGKDGFYRQLREAEFIPRLAAPGGFWPRGDRIREEPGRLLQRIIRDPGVNLGSRPPGAVVNVLYWAKTLAICLCAGGGAVYLSLTLFSYTQPKWPLWLPGIALALGCGILEYCYLRGLRMTTMARYLIERREDIATAGEDGPAERRDVNISINLTLNRCAKAIKRQNNRIFQESGGELFTPIYLVVQLLTHLKLCDHLGWDSGTFLVVAFNGGALISLVIYLFISTRFSGLSRRIRREIEATDIATQLALGSIDVSLLREYVPTGLHWFADWPRRPRELTGRMESDIWTLAYNIDWFLKPPERLLRPFWVGRLIQLGIGIPLLFILMLYGGWNLITAAGLVLMCAIFFVPGYITTYHRVRRRAWSEELIAYLRQQLVEDGPDIEDK